MAASIALVACGVDELLVTGAGDAERDASPDAGAEAAAEASIDAELDGAPDAEADAGTLVASARAPSYALVGEQVTLDGSASTGAVAYQWSFGNGDGSIDPGPDPIATVVYDAPGRYPAVLTAIGPRGDRRTDSVTVTVTHPSVHVSSHSSTVATVPDERRVAVASPDSNELAVYAWDDADAFRLVARVATPAEPRSVTPWAGRLAAPCQGADAVLTVRTDGSDAKSVAMPYGSRPYGAAVLGAALFVTLQGTGEVARVELDANADPVVVDRIPVIHDARAIASLPDGRLAVTRFRSPSDDSRAEIGVLDPESGAVEIWPLAFDPRESTDSAIGGVPSYLSQILVSPTARELAVPSLQANSASGTHNAGVALDFETTVRGVVSFFDLPSGTERFLGRRQFDNRGFAAAGVWSSHGDFLYLAMRGSRSVERLDALTNAHSGTILAAGFAPQGLALSADDRLLFVDAYLSRELVVYDVTSFESLPEPIARLAIPSAEPLAPEILRGKQLFDDALDARLGKDQYMACAHCHLEGDSDRRVWDFTDRGEGLRNTISLLGRAGTGDGPVHWSANFDEIQDFENDIRGPFAGTGLLSDADWNAGTTKQPLGDPKAAKSADLDALATYVASLSEERRSPFRLPDGSLSAAAIRGKASFESPATQCISCHFGPRLTDSAFVTPGVPRLHDVGTLGPGSGRRLGVTLAGIDTPTLHGLWHSAPYLHDGSAKTLDDVLVARNASDLHGATSTLSSSEIADLVAYLLSLDGRRQ